MTQTRAWQERLDKNMWVNAYMNSATTAKILAREHDLIKGVLKELQKVK